MKTFGRELSSKDHWESLGSTYTEELENRYHTHRLLVIRALIPPELFQSGKKIFEFGCGDAVLFPDFLQSGALIDGIDISSIMIQKAGLRLGKERSHLAQVGDVNNMKKIKSNSLDAVISFNVLAYLTDREEEIFYKETSRILKPGGYLIVTHSNELFDMFSLNKYTVEFMNRNLISTTKNQNKIKQLLTYADSPENPVSYNIRENPLAYKYKLAGYGFQELSQEFINLHECPPPVLKEKQFPDTLGYEECDKWKLMFICSTFGSCSIKKN